MSNVSDDEEGAMKLKLMMSSGGALIAAMLSVTVAAQSGGTSANGGKMDKMAMKDTTYTGCVEAGSAPTSFMLTHLAADDHMGKDAMKKDAMKKDTMAKDAMSKDTMAPTTWSLASSSVDLSKHVGHKVTVTGSPAQSKMDAMGKDAMGKDAMGKSAPVFHVTALKMVAASCP
jgi:pentapeptide MXKDX repeat protein